MTWTPWIVAFAAYALFLEWYRNWRGPLTRAEIERAISRLAGSRTEEVNDVRVLREFLEADDGRDFVMLNLVRVRPGTATHPATGLQASGRELLEGYTRRFLPALMRRAGHPAFVARKIGGYVDAWQVSPDPGWTIVGAMRYRSRRDLAELVADPLFLEIHPLKMAGTAETLSFPMRTTMRLVFGPTVWIAMLLALGAAFAQIAMLLQGAGA